MIKYCEYVKLVDGTIYIPPPSSVMGGMARDRWIRRLFPPEAVILIAGDKIWKELIQNHEVQVASDEGR